MSATYLDPPEETEDIHDGFSFFRSKIEWPVGAMPASFKAPRKPWNLLDNLSNHGIAWEMTDAPDGYVLYIPANDTLAAQIVSENGSWRFLRRIARRFALLFGKGDQE